MLAAILCTVSINAFSETAPPPATTPVGGESENIQRLYRDQQGTIWIGTQNAIERLTSAGTDVLPSVGGITAEITMPFADDNGKGMFFITSGGLFRWEKGSVRTITLNLGNGDAPVALYRDPMQRLWLGTRTGVYELKPRENSFFVLSSEPAYDAILHASVHGTVTALTGDAAGNLWIGTSSDGLWELDRNGLVRATRGSESDSVASSEKTDTTPQGARSTVYELWLFYGLFAVAAGLICAYLLRRKMQLMTGRLGIVLEERNRIASECHDTLMAGFAAISWQLEATAKLFKDSGADTTPAAKSCELARSMVSHCQAEARRIIWDLRDTGEVTDVLSQALSRALTAGHLQASIETTLDVEGDEVHLAPGCVHHLVCIGQEAVSNALRHAQPSKIIVNLRYDIDSLSLSIRDNGHGFLQSDRSISRRGHFGIPVMEERARKLGGTFRIQTAAGAGTEVLVRVAYNALQQPVNQQHHVIRWIGI
jgi:signal transduction histidine kinase